MWLPLFPCGIWTRTARSEQLVLVAFDAARTQRWNDSEFADVLDVPGSQVSRMRSGCEAGPGFARFAQLPDGWWVAFLSRVAPLFGLRVFSADDVAVAALDFQAERKRMARMRLPEERQEQVS